MGKIREVFRLKQWGRSQREIASSLAAAVGTINGYVRHAKPSMRRVHRAGEKAFVDFSGKKARLTNPETGEQIDVELFAMVLGASNYSAECRKYLQG